MAEIEVCEADGRVGASGDYDLRGRDGGEMTQWFWIGVGGAAAAIGAALLSRRGGGGPTAKQFTRLMLDQVGDRYELGAETSPEDSDPSVWDCSEIIEWACSVLQVVPRMPDGSWLQAKHCRDNGTLTSIEEAAKTEGALLFRFDSDPFTAAGRPKSAHVAVSLGDGRTVEARSTQYGVGTFKVAGRNWTHAGRVPGLRY